MLVVFKVVCSSFGIVLLTP
ncbi:hypothetical protein CGK04_23640 [Vibrio parahaemolyticus]|nr:hypothetical protein CGK04_23640 [Vibrio parahaemolyticus]